MKLEQNYRSTQTILSAANAVVSHNEGRKPKELWTDLGEGEPVHVRRARGRARRGALRRRRRSSGSRDEEGSPRSDVAVFYRTNAQSRVLEDTLVRFGVAYQVIGGTKFYERAEIKDALAYLTLLVNPQDTVSFARVVNSPKRGIGQTTSGPRGRPREHDGRAGAGDVAVVPEDVPGLGPAAVKALDRLRVRDGAAARAGRAHVRRRPARERSLQETGYFEALEAERTIEAQGRLENLQELVGVGARVRRQLGGRAAACRGSRSSSSSSRSTRSRTRSARRDELVTLMTLHNAKGLEYPVVFMIGCEEGVFPHSRSIDEGNLEEERRLCYVGITRARAQALHDATRARARCTARAPTTCPRASSTSCRAELTDAEEAPPARQSGEPAAARRSAAPLPFHVGDDVVHATLRRGRRDRDASRAAS